MSRSNPTENVTPNPATRWFEWNGEHGLVRYYDKEEKKQVEVGSDFTFLLLDQLGSVRGWDDATESGIYSNEVKDTRQDVLVVRSFKGGTLAQGLYKDIKERVNSIGGQFVTNCYIAFKQNGGLALGSLRLKGATLGAWMEFCKAHRADLLTKAVRIRGYTEGKKGRIVFRTPIFEVANTSPETDHAATRLDAVLQEFFKGYLKRNTNDRTEQVAAQSAQQDSYAFDQGEHLDEPPQAPLTDDDIPF